MKEPSAKTKQYDYSKLKARAVELGVTSKAVAKAGGMTPSTYSLKLNGKGEFTQEQMRNICDFLNIGYCEIPRYFFTLQVQFN